MKASSSRGRKLSPTAQRIREIQKGNPVPKAAVAKVISRWDHDVAQQFKQRKAIRDLDRRNREKMLGKLLTSFSKGGLNNQVQHLSGRVLRWEPTTSI
jgi:hypothetical protein